MINFSSKSETHSNLIVRVPEINILILFCVHGKKWIARINTNPLISSTSIYEVLKYLQNKNLITEYQLENTLYNLKYGEQ